tara:strand:+ start:220 stop:501 length:282 start_codon:yes stop_codon:yes gene_type:complete
MDELVTERIKETYSELVICEEREREAITNRIIAQKDFDDAKEDYRMTIISMIENVIEKEKQKGVLIAKNKGSRIEGGIKKRLINLICHFLQSQ